MFNDILHHWPLLLALVERTISLGAACHAILQKRDVRAAIGWTGLVFLAPLFGSFLYFWFGVNRLRRRGGELQAALEKTLRQTEVAVSPAMQEQLERAIERFPRLAKFNVLVGKLTGRPLLPNNDVRALVNGTATYPAMISAIHAAQESISLQSYIFAADETGYEFIDALTDAHRRGVEVRVLIDDVGGGVFDRAYRELRRRGVPAATFLPTRLPRLSTYANLRNHRKIMVVDGVVGFTGGTNIRHEGRLSLDDPRAVQDVHFRVIGPVVSHLQEIFLADWLFTTGELLNQPCWYWRPEIARRWEETPEVDVPASANLEPQETLPGQMFSTVWARGIADGPDEDFEKLLMTMLGAIATARERIVIVSPYFLPDTSLIHALGAAGLSGVDVTIILPQDNNNRLVHWAATAMLPAILERGCRVFLSAPPFDHSKLMFVDDAWILFGSTNWDPRSLRLNFEFNVECYSPRLVSEMAELVEQKRRGAVEVTLDMVNARPLPIRLRDGIARLFTPYI